MEAKTTFPELQLARVDQSLIARLIVAERASPVTVMDVQQAIRQSVWVDAKLDSAAQQALLEHAKTNKAFEVAIGEVRDAAIKIDVARDKLAVTCKHTPALGGEPLTIASIIEQLKATGISESCILQDVLTDLLNSTEPLVVARGRAPEVGKDTQFVPTFDIDTTASPSVDEHDIVDYFDTKHYVTVEEGDVVMKRSSATSGEPGIDVYGKTLPAKKGKEFKFKKYPGTAISTEDDSQLIATMQGHPVLETAGVKVDETLVIREANLDSGHINFNGSVMIQGSVLPQVRVVATGDIFVKGTVENATLEAGHSLVIGGGVISESVPEKEEPPKITTKLRAGLDIHAAYLSLTDAVAGQDVTIRRYLMHSNVTVGRQLIVGEKGGRGVILAGQTHAGQSITANVAGSVGYVQTMISCGNLEESLPALNATKRLIAQRSDELAQLEKILARIKPEAAPVVGDITLHRPTRIEAVCTKIRAALEELNQQAEGQSLQVANDLKAQIQINRAVFPGAQIAVNGQHANIPDERGKTTFSYRKDKIHIQ